jgi:NDP-sugar pyrophosphorylase family protein
VLETGGGIKKASRFFEPGKPFVVINADILTNLDLNAMIQAHEQAKPMGTLAVTNRHSSRALLFDSNKTLCGWQNTKTGEQKGLPGNPMAFSGIQILDPGIFDHMRFTGKFSMIDVYLDLCKTFAFKAFDHSQSLFADIGTPEKLLEAEKWFK